MDCEQATGEVRCLGLFFFFQAEDGIRDLTVTGVQTCALPIYTARGVNLPHNSAETVPLQYDVPAYAMNVRVALTNKVPVTPVRGAGHPQGKIGRASCRERV